MEHIISVETFGARIRTRDGMFVVHLPDLSGAGDHREESFAACHVHTILLHQRTSISSDALLLAEANKVSVIVMNEQQLPAVFMAGARAAASVDLWKRQLLIHNTPQGLAFARQWLIAKIQRKIEWLSKMRSYRSGPALQTIEQCITALRNCIVRMHAVPLHREKAAASLRGIEGTGQRLYLDTLNTLLPTQNKFDGRSRQPSADLFNAALNYAYGILYNWTEQALWSAGLNPYIGCMHSDERHQKALLFDFIEGYRPWMDKIVFKLCFRREINAPQHTVSVEQGGLWLNRAGKALLIAAVKDRFNRKTIELDGMNRPLLHVISYEARLFATALAALALPAAEAAALVAEYC